MSLADELLETEQSLWVHAVRDGAPYVARVSSGYVQRDGSWRMMFHQTNAARDDRVILEGRHA